MNDIEIRRHLRDAHDLAHAFRYSDADVETVVMRRYLSCATCNVIAREVLQIAPFVCTDCAAGNHQKCIDCDCQTLPMPQHSEPLPYVRAAERTATKEGAK